MKAYSNIAGHNRETLKEIDQKFIEFLKEQNSQISDGLIRFRQNPNLSKANYSEFIISTAPYLEDFIARLYKIEPENNDLRVTSNSLNIIFEARRKFVERYAIRHYQPASLNITDLENISLQLKRYIKNLTQENIAVNCLRWLQDKDQYKNQIDIAAKYCSLMVKINSSLALFDIPRKVDENNHIRQYRINQLVERTKIGFDFRDSESRADNAQTHGNYCLYCHKNHKDSCSTGFNRPQDSSQGSLQESGCPLKQKISEMNLLRSQGYNIAALATIIIDNPLVALTGHRICNDCAKACIFQKQTPVNIPLVETNILESVLSLPYGVEIYYLLTQWNPLILDSYLPEESNGYNILVAGLGPAGIAASYYFCRQGYQVFAVDGLKILDNEIDIYRPIKNWSDIGVKLQERVSQGFGGVAEYGITNRWNKNLLLLARLILERNSNFNYRGSVRLGSNLTTSRAFQYGFDHIALCLGAGKPKYLSDSGYFLRGVKSSADFLMQLQQASAFNSKSTSNLQVRLPAYVYGCGLTAIDSAVELLNYYPVMVKNFVAKYTNDTGKRLSDEEGEIAQEYLAHAEIFAKCKNDKELIKAITDLGGVNIIYRKKIQDSPAYARNHEEIEHAMATGVGFIEERSIIKVLPDKHGHIKAIELSDGTIKEVGTLLLGLGTGQCDFTDISGEFDLNDNFFKSSNHRISYFGDCNPAYHGSVVKAIASVKDGYMKVSESIKSKSSYKLNYSQLVKDLSSEIIRNSKISDQYTEIIISSPLAVENYKAGQFFKLQNMSRDIIEIMEPMVISPYKIDRSKGELSFLINNIGKSSAIASNLQAGDKVSLMGPAGEAIDIPCNTKVTAAANKPEILSETMPEIMIISKEIGAAISMPLVELLVRSGHKVYLVADISIEISNILELDAAWQDQSNLIIHKIANNQTIDNLLSIMHEEEALANIRQIYIYGNNDFEQQAEEYINKYFHKDTKAISMINVPMQCLMKGICGQCIQKVNDERGYIFACSNNAQSTNSIDFSSLKQRHKMNSLLEKVY